MHKLNQENTPEVGDVPELTEFQNLIALSEYIVIAQDKADLVGFMLCMKEGNSYKSKNYLYLSGSYPKFLYVDRIAIQKDYRRKGLGRNIYKQVIESAESLRIPLLCEVNIKPRNIASLAFHRNLGFKEVGNNDFESYSVMYLKKDP